MNMYSKILTPILFCFVVPPIGIILILCYLYRLIVKLILKLQLKDKFMQLLDGTDCVWAIEDSSTPAVINILAILEKDPRQPNINILDNFKRIFKERLVNSSCDKLLYVRKKKLGYYYWEKEEEAIDLDERVRWLEHDHSECDGTCDDIYGQTLRKTIRDISIEPLPRNNTTSWEILIGRNCPRSSYHRMRCIEEIQCLFGDQRTRRKHMTRIPILFRVHHSLGDGPSLVKLLVKNIADPEKSDDTIFQVPDNCLSIRMSDELFEIDRDFIGTSESLAYSKIIQSVGISLNNYSITFWKTVTVLNFVDFMRKIHHLIYQRWINMTLFITDLIDRYIQVLGIVLSAPMCFVRQTLNSMDNSALHGPLLTGKKLISCWIESDHTSLYEQNLFTKIRDIKSITGARFNDIVLAALSSSLNKYFERIDEATPKSVSVVVPLRVENKNEQYTLENQFSVAVLPLSISKINEKTRFIADGQSQIFNRLCDVTRTSNVLRQRSDYTINYWLMKFVAGILPVPMLRPALGSQCTMIFSNVPGPQEVEILNHRVKNIVVWTPNKSTTGIGLTILTYGGYINFSIIADEAVMKDEEHLSQILQHTVSEIDNLHSLVTLSCLSRKFFYAQVSAPMDQRNGYAVKEKDKEHDLHASIF